MTPERFRGVEELYQALYEASEDERAARPARTDPDLRLEVKPLLSQHLSGDFLDRPAIQNAPELIKDLNPDGLAVGAHLEPYCIPGKLFEGGMGEVFRAVVSGPGIRQVQWARKSNPVGAQIRIGGSLATPPLLHQPICGPHTAFELSNVLDTYKKALHDAAARVIIS